MQQEALSVAQLLVAQGHTLSPFLAFLFFVVLLWFDDNLNRPLSTSFLIPEVCRELAILLTDLLLR